MGEESKHRELVRPYTSGNGVDIGSSGEPIVPWAIQIDLPFDAYKTYNVTRPASNCIHWRGDGTRDLPFKDQVLDFVHSSHLLEDFPRDQWKAILNEWHRVLKVGGHMIVAVPDHERFRSAVRRGQGDNLSHKSESRPGELTEWLKSRYDIIMDQFVTPDPNEYSIIFLGRNNNEQPL